MSQFRLRLVSGICVAAYLFANTHVNLALAAFPPLGHTDDSAAPTECDSATFSKCQHCAERKHSAPNPDSPKQSIPANKDTPCPCSPDEPRGPSCPCCPDGP